MGKDLEKFDAKQFAESIREKIQGQIGSLIPDSLFQQMIEKEIIDFQANVLPLMVKEQLTELYKEKLRAQFNNPEWQQQYLPNSGDMAASELVTKIVKEAAPELVATLFGNITQNIVQNLRHNQY